MGKSQLTVDQWVMTGAQSVELYLEEVGELVSQGNHYPYTQQYTEKLLERILPITRPTQPCIEGNSCPFVSYQ